MKNYLCFNGRKIELTAEQCAQILAETFAPASDRKLSEYAPKETVKVGPYEMVVLDQTGDTTVLICKEPLPGDKAFGETNNYNGSYADEFCNQFAEEIAVIVGEENLVWHTVDLTTDDGLKDYGTCERKGFLLTTEEQHRYVDVLDEHKVGRRCWLATALTTKKHGDDRCVKCVAPPGYFYGSCCDIGRISGVRPACILKSDIFVSD